MDRIILSPKISGKTLIIYEINRYREFLGKGSVEYFKLDGMGMNYFIQ